MFIKRIHRYAAKQLKSGATRIYILLPNVLKAAGLAVNTRIKIDYQSHQIVITPCEQGTNKIMDTGRGELLEIKNKQATKSLGNIDQVAVTFRRGKVVISLHQEDRQRIQRETVFMDKILSSKPLRFGSLFSGLGLLALSLKQGFEKAGVKTQMVWANEMEPIPLDVNLSSNPIWANAAKDAVAFQDSLENIDPVNFAGCQVVELGYPCVGQSSLCAADRRDLKHPHVGTLFVSVLAVLKRVNPAVIIIENTELFKNSTTLEIFKRELSGYNFTEKTFNGHRFGSIESRKRICIVATSKGLAIPELDTLQAPAVSHKPLSSYLEPVAANSPLWREMNHVKSRDNDTSHNYKNTVHRPTDKQIGCVTASYNSPKANTPMLAHPTDPKLQRQLTVVEHARIRKLPSAMMDSVISVFNGTHPLVTRRGSKEACHRMLGNSVSMDLWNAIGHFLGCHFSKNTQIQTV